MSEHIQPAPSMPVPHHAPLAETEPERTPGVAHEKTEFSMSLVLWVAFGLIVAAVVIHFAVWGLLARDMKHELPPPGSESGLAMADANRELAKRLLDVPPPHLEGIEGESSLLVLRVGEQEERRFYVGPTAHVRIGDKENARLFELREGQEVTIHYHMPGGDGGGFAVVTSVFSPPPTDRSAKNTGHELPQETQSITGTVLRIEPRSVAAAREWAEAQMNRYGWTDRQKQVARIPITVAMEEVLKDKEFQPPRKKGEGAFTQPTRSNSGRGTGEEKK